MLLAGLIVRDITVALLRERWVEHVTEYFCDGLHEYSI